MNCGMTCSATWTTGSTVTLTATPGANSTFGGWTGVACNGGNASATCTFTLTGTTNITATFTLNNLTVGKTYVLTSYNGQFGGAGGRVTTVAGSSGASTVYDQNLAAGLNLLRYTFVASSASEALTYTPTNPGNTWHFYGFSNEQVFNNTWSPTSGSSWNTPANWSTGVVPNATGTNASFSARPGPTTVTLNGAKTVGHIQFLGTGDYTITGSQINLKADAGGVSVLNTEAGGSHTIEAGVNLQSDAVKFGADVVDRIWKLWQLYQSMRFWTLYCLE